MRFSLRTLFWIFPVTLVAYGLAYVEASLYFIDTYQEANAAFNQVESNAQAFADYLQTNPAPHDIKLLNLWLDNKLPPNNPQGMIYDSISGPVYRNPLKAVALDEQGNPLPEQQQAILVGFYVRRSDVAPFVELNSVEVLNASTVNSWSTTRGEAREIDRQKIHHRIQTRAILNWPWAMVLLILFILVWMPLVDSMLKKLRAKGTRDPSIPQADKVWPL